MNIYDYILPIIVIIIIASLVVYFHQMRNMEGFNSDEPQNTGFVNISKNLFIGFNSVNESDNHLEALKEASVKFPDKLGDKDFQHSIIINGAESTSNPPPPSIQKICLGTGEEYETKCIDETNIDTSMFSMFKDNANKQVYYNEDQPVIRHDKLCIPYGNSDEVCLNQSHLELINGSYAINLKKSNTSPNQTIHPYNITYGSPDSGNSINNYFYTFPDQLGDDCDYQQPIDNDKAFIIHPEPQSYYGTWSHVH